MLKALTSWFSPILCIAILFQAAPIEGEVFTSMADMENLITTEKFLLSSLKSYIQSEEVKLGQIREFMNRVNDAHKYIDEVDIGKYLGNPVNVYLMLRRLSVQWKQMETTLQEDTAEGEDLNAVFDIAKAQLPTKEDHQGAMTALFRLQNTYKLSSNKLAKGIIPGVTGIFSQELDLKEIYEIGRHAYEMEDYFYARDWLSTALEVMGNQSSVLGIERSVVLDYLAFSEFKQGNIRSAFKLTQELAKLDPTEPRFLSNLEYYQEELRVSRSTGLRGDPGTIDDAELYKGITRENPVGSQTEASNKRTHLQDYEKLCRGEIRSQTKKEIRRMNCWYKNDDPLLLLKPQKVERIWSKPEIFRFHEILTETQISEVKENAYPMLKRATIQDPITGKLQHADYRVSKSAWLSPSRHAFVREMAIRAQAATGLDIRSAEQLQIANYGIGGHYEPHFDHAREDEDKFTDLGMGNRIATLLYYLSDVEAGGATVFTAGRTAVFPKKGDAVFWFNLKRNGLGNPDTRHAACPVLVGQKWVSNWWIHEYGQEFRRQCGLNETL